MVNMCAWLRCYLYALFLICVSTMTHALEVTQIEKNMGGFAFPVFCSHPSDLNLCVNQNDGKDAACKLYEPLLDSRYSYAYKGIDGANRCWWQGKIPDTNTTSNFTASIIIKTGLCPTKDAPPPEKVNFGRQGRWFPQELESNRCYKSCEYSGGQSFSYKHLLFTNAVYTQFTDAGGLKSNQKFCEMKPEPIRDSSGEITYESNCDDATFKQFCDFINWFRNDSEMPEAPKVEAEQINLGYIKADHIQIEHNADNLCFAPYEFYFFLPWSRDEVKQEIRFDLICTKIKEFGNLWRALYLIAACYIIFGGRK